MAKGRVVAIVLDDAERDQLIALTRKHGAPQALAERARIILAAARGLDNKEVAAKVGVCAATAGTWRNRFAENRIDGLYDEPRPGAPRQIGDDEIASTIRKTLETLPKGATHRSLRSMAREIGHAPSTVHRIWQAFGLQPHRSETFKLSSDPLFVEKVRDIVGLYLSPPERAVVLCVDEKSQVQALDRTQPLLPMRPGQAERRTHDYKRNGTTSLFAALDVKAGTIVGKCMTRHRALEATSPADLEVALAAFRTAQADEA
jgi:transposase